VLLPTLRQTRKGEHMKTTIELAREAGADTLMYWDIEKLKRFESLVRADEREACAKVCDKRYMGDNNREDMEAKRCAAAIRNRGNT
jgi:glutamine phosphoribosylpyrophosphate amidotransferase